MAATRGWRVAMPHAPTITRATATQAARAPTALHVPFQKNGWAATRKGVVPTISENVWYDGILAALVCRSQACSPPPKSSHQMFKSPNTMPAKPNDTSTRHGTAAQPLRKPRQATTSPPPATAANTTGNTGMYTAGSTAATPPARTAIPTLRRLRARTKNSMAASMSTVPRADCANPRMAISLRDSLAQIRKNPKVATHLGAESADLRSPYTAQVLSTIQMAVKGPTYWYPCMWKTLRNPPSTVPALPG